MFNFISTSHSDCIEIEPDGLNLVKRGTRMSLTFRKTMSADCTCSYAEYCCNDRFVLVLCIKGDVGTLQNTTERLAC